MRPSFSSLISGHIAKRSDRNEGNSPPDSFDPCGCVAKVAQEGAVIPECSSICC